MYPAPTNQSHECDVLFARRPEHTPLVDTTSALRQMNAARLHWLMRALPVSTIDVEMGSGPILILAPHPDDETLGCGGLIATAQAAGRAVFVLVLTDGTGSHPNSGTYPAARLRKLREAESRMAARMLGLPESHVDFLGLVDTHAPQRGEAAEQAARAIAAHAQACGAGVILTTWRHDPHCDHLSASILGARAAALTGAALFEYPVWGWTLPPRRLLQARAPTGFRLDVARHVSAKQRAIACHKSQLGQVITDDPEGFTLESQFVGLFTDRYETFLRVQT